MPSIHKYLFLSCAWMTLILGGCNNYQFMLPNGYSFFKANSYESAILAPKPQSDIIVGPNVKLFEVIGDVVVGVVESPSNSSTNSSRTIESKEGYFLLNTKDGSIKRGLSKKLLDTELKKRGVQGTILRSP